jgi:CheY-like chemotaxis protein
MLKLMLIEDSAVDRKYLDLLVRIKKLPLEVVGFDNPYAALDDLFSEGWPDILLIDINIPLLSGFEILDRLLAENLEKPAATEVYVNSASSRLEDRRRAEAHPLVDGFFEKPIRDQHLLDIIRRIEGKTTQNSRT